MVSGEYVEQQLAKIGFKLHGWGRSEVGELKNILIPDEQIFECVNGFYDGGFSLLVATDLRVLMVDKKPFNYLTVADLRFDMINEIDYSHRMIGADIFIASGDKTLHFRSYNQHRLRKLVNHIQDCMADAKRKQTSSSTAQSRHLKRINQKLQEYLAAQQNQQVQLQQIQLAQQLGQPINAEMPKPIKPDPELADYLYAQSLLTKHQEETGRQDLPIQSEPLQAALQVQAPPLVHATDSQLREMYADGIKEIFGRHEDQLAALKIAYSKLPMLLRNRKFGLPLTYGLTKPSGFESAIRPTQNA